jgi:hypothetical protein
MDAELRQALRHARPSTTGWWRGDCPYCEDKLGTPGDRGNLSISVGTGHWMCWRCDAKGRDRDLHNEVEGGRAYAAQAAVAGMKDQERWELPEGFVSLRDPDVWRSSALSPAIEYLLGRVPRRVCEEAGLGLLSQSIEPMWSTRIIVPITDAHGVLRGYVGRRWFHNCSSPSPPYLYPAGMKRGEVLFNEGALQVETSEPTFVVEGCFDALPHWPHAVACLGKPTEQHYAKLLQARRPLVVVLDRDATDESWALAANLRLDGRRAASLELPNDVKDPGDLSSSRLRQLASAG